MKRVLALLVLVLVVIAGAMAWQQSRYLDTRRNVVMDRQPMLYGGDVFHVVTFLRTRAEADVIDEVRSFHEASEGLEGAAWVYAGKAAMTSVSS